MMRTIRLSPYERKIGMICAFILMSILNSLSSQENRKVYSIQVFAAKDEPNAQVFAQSLIQKGYTPVEIIPRGEYKAVVLGKFEKYADALYYKNRIREKDYADAFIVTRDVSTTISLPALSDQNLQSREIFQGIIRNSNVAIFSGLEIKDILVKPEIPQPIVQISPEILAADNTTLSENDLMSKAVYLAQEKRYPEAIAAQRTFLDRFPSNPKASNALLNIGYIQIKQGNRNEAKSSFEQIVQTYPQTDQAGEAALRLGYLKLSEAKSPSDENYSEAQSKFEKIAQGEIQATPSTRLESMVRCAKIYHARKDRSRALQAYREIASLTDADGVPDPDIHLELAGLYLELALSEKGSLDDCISQCNHVLSMGNATEECRATAMTMKGESLFLQMKYPECLAVMNQIVSQYPSQRRACMMAQSHIGAIYFDQGDFIKSRKIFQDLVQNYTDQDNWPYKNLRGNAILFLARMEMAEKNKDKACDYLQQVWKTWPGSPEAEKASIYLKRYYQEQWEIIKNNNQ